LSRFTLRIDQPDLKRPRNISKQMFPIANSHCGGRRIRSYGWLESRISCSSQVNLDLQCTNRQKSLFNTYFAKIPLAILSLWRV
jgi:hypothetical protein